MSIILYNCSCDNKCRWCVATCTTLGDVASCSECAFRAHWPVWPTDCSCSHSQHLTWQLATTTSTCRVRCAGAPAHRTRARHRRAVRVHRTVRSAPTLRFGECGSSRRGSELLAYSLYIKFTLFYLKIYSHTTITLCSQSVCDT